MFLKKRVIHQSAPNILEDFCFASIQLFHYLLGMFVLSKKEILKFQRCDAKPIIQYFFPL